MKLFALQAVLWMICAYHLVMGLGAVLSDEVARGIARTIFGIELKLTPQTSYLVKLLGVYTAVFGVATGLAAIHATDAPWLLNLVVLLYALRIANKYGYRRLYQEAFEAPPSRITQDLALLAFFGGSVWLLRP